MLTRVIAALALVPLFIFIVIGGIPLYIAEIVILAMALREFYKAFNAINIHPIENIGYIFIAYMGLKNILNLGVEYTYIMIFLLFMYSITYLLRCKNNVIDIAIGAKENIPKKPAPDALFMCAKEQNIDLKNVIYVGDSDVDVATAKNAGVTGIAVTWGFRSRETLKKCGAEILVKNTKELSDVLQQCITKKSY